MKKLALALTFLLASAAGAFAACSSPALMHDFPGTSFNMSLATNATDGNCASNVTIVGAPPAVTATGSGWTSATTSNSTQTLMAVGAGAPALLVQLNQTTTIAGGAITFEGTYDNTNWVTIPVAQVLNPNTLAPLTNPYTLVASTNQPFLLLTQGYQSVRIRLSTVITGSATVTPFTTLLPYNPTVSALLNPLAAGSAIIGKVGIDPINNGVINGANVYQLFAASSGPTAFTGGGGGATGDYLSHCTVIPTTISPGVATILDNTTAIYSFPGGASSLSNLVPFAIPIGAKSISGAWKVTLGAGLSMVCEGKPT